MSDEVTNYVRKRKQPHYRFGGLPSIGQHIRLVGRGIGGKVIRVTETADRLTVTIQQQWGSFLEHEVTWQDYEVATEDQVGII